MRIRWNSIIAVAAFVAILSLDLGLAARQAGQGQAGGAAAGAQAGQRGGGGRGGQRAPISHPPGLRPACPTANRI